MSFCAAAGEAPSASAGQRGEGSFATVFMIISSGRCGLAALDAPRRSVVTTWLPETLGVVPQPCQRSAQGVALRETMMALRWTDWPAEVLATLRRGAVIPAHPLALDADRKLDARRQRALTRYYLDAGAGGLAVGVHTTQFAIRDVGLYRPVLELAMRTAREWARRRRR